MYHVLRVLSDGAPRRQIEVARIVGPNGSLRYGYLYLWRAARKGWITIRPDPAHKGRTIATITATGLARIGV